jgi:predicted DNA-binding transcriptional regulator AlpA
MQRLVRFKDLKARGIVGSRTQLGRFERDHGFPAAFYLSPSIKVWDEGEVEAWVASRRAASNAGEGGPNAPSLVAQAGRSTTPAGARSTSNNQDDHQPGGKPSHHPIA